MKSKTLATWTGAVCLASALALAACGGGGGGGSVGSGGTGGTAVGLAVGTVNGFGSVIVDGVRYDDTNAAAVAEDSPGHDARVEAQIGHRVEIEFEQAGTARNLRVEATVKGAVTSVTPASSQLVVLGQTVRMNADPAAGPVTQFGGGYVSLASVAVNDAVEIHGILVPQGGSSIIQATRVQHEDSLPGFLRVTGIVANAAAGSFRLGGLSVTTAGATIVPAGTAVQDGQVVRVMAQPTALSASGPTLAAAQVRIKNEPREGNSEMQVSGTVASLDTTARTFLIGQQRVDYSAAAFNPAGTTPANGQYVRVRGQANASGTLMATEVALRNGRNGNENEAELRGNIGDLDTVARTFSVRDVTVDFSGLAASAITGCPATLANGLFVEVEGNLSATRVVATRIQCENEAAGSVVERRGTAGQVNATARTFVLTTTGGPVNVAWNDTTLFRDVTAQTLDGKTVQVEGVLSGTTLSARTVRLRTSGGGGGGGGN